MLIYTAVNECSWYVHQGLSNGLSHRGLQRIVYHFGKMLHSGTPLEYFGHHFIYLIELAFVGVKFMVIHSIDADILLDHIFWCSDAQVFTC